MKPVLPQRNFQSDLILKNKPTLLKAKKISQSKNSKPAEEIKEEEKVPDIVSNPLSEKIEKIEETQQFQSISCENPKASPEKSKEREDKDDKSTNNNSIKMPKASKIEPILKQKQTKKPQETSRNSTRNGKTEAKKETEQEKKPNKETEPKTNEVSPLRPATSNNAEGIDFKKFASKFEDCNGDFEGARFDLINRIKMITSKTFLNIKNLIKPQENIRVICMAFVSLFGENLGGFETDFYSSQEIKEWPNLHKFFENPGQLLNLISRFEELVEQGLISERGVKYSMDMLIEFSKNTNSENHEFNFEIIKVLAEFINSACRYFRSYKINELKISPIKSIDTPIQQSKVIHETTDQTTTPLERDPLPEKNKPQIPKPEQNKTKTIEPPQNSSRSVSNTSKINKEKMLADRKKEMDNYVAKKKGMTKKNKLERIMNLKVKKPSVTSALKDYLNKSSDFQDSFSSKKKKKNEQSFNDGSQSSLDEIRKAQKEIREMEATKTRIMMLYEKQKKKDAELEESQRLKDLILQEKDDETKMKEYLNKRKKEEKTEISSFRKELLMESRQQKKQMTENCKSNEIQSLTKEKEKEISIKREEEKTKKNKQREESNERLEHIQFIREQKKKQREEELRNQSQEYEKIKEEKLKQKKKEILQMKENLESELFQTLQIFQKGKIV